MILFPEYQGRGTGRREKNSPKMDDSDDGSAGLLAIEDLSVLVVDDQADSARIIARILAQEGAEVKWATSVAEALKIVQNFHPRLIISDLAMPQEDGFELLRQFRASHTFAENGLIPVIAVSAYSDPKTMQKSFEEGFQAFLPKPVHRRFLLDAVGKLAMLQEHLQTHDPARLPTEF